MGLDCSLDLTPRYYRRHGRKSMVLRYGANIVVRQAPRNLGAVERGL